MTTNKSQRSDYRTAPVGSLTHYLIYVYPKMKDFEMSVLTEYGQIHMVGRDQGNYTHTDGTGHLRENPLLMRDLIGTSWLAFRDAINDVRAMNGLSLSGESMIKILEWYQNADLNNARGYTQAVLAKELNIASAKLRQWLDRAVSLIEALVYERARNNVGEMNKKAG